MVGRGYSSLQVVVWHVQPITLGSVTGLVTVTGLLPSFWEVQQLSVRISVTVTHNWLGQVSPGTISLCGQWGNNVNGQFLGKPFHRHHNTNK